MKSAKAHPSFLDNLNRLLTSGNPCIRWSQDGTCIEITNRDGLVELIRLHSNSLRQTKYSSFQRQLTSYGFYKVMGKYPRDVCLYRNPLWTRDYKANHRVVRRKSETNRIDLISEAALILDEFQAVKAAVARSQRLQALHNSTNTNQNTHHHQLAATVQQ